MTLFSYTARDENGNMVDGTMDAVSTQAVRDSLGDMQLIVEEVHEATQSDQNTMQSWDTAPSVPFQNISPLEEKKPPITVKEKTAKQAYFPIVDTLRLYGGWLLAWYCLVYAFGFYQSSKDLPFRIPYVESLFLSPLVLSFTLVAFLFLLLSELHKKRGGGRKLGWIFVIIGIAVFWIYRVNVV